MELHGLKLADLNTGRYSYGLGGGDSTSALALHGETPSIANTESWNGSAWTEVNRFKYSKRKYGGGNLTKLFFVITSSNALNFGG